MNLETLELNIGPQHPSAQGIFRMNLKLDGERIMGLEPVMGYLHRNHEQIAENMSYAATMPFTDRLDYLSSMSNNFGYALSVERLAGFDVPERAEYIRVIMAELTRIANHIAAVGFMLNDMGAFYTPLIYGFREREKILDIFESVSGSRMMCNFFRFGGVKRDLTPDAIQEIKNLISQLPSFLDEYERLLISNEVVCLRCQNVGVLSSSSAVNSSVTGPILRACGVNYDIRKIDGYSVYNRLSFRIPIGEKGDVYDRYRVRLLEARESISIIRQALEQMPGGEIMSKKALPFLKAPRNFKPPVGESYARVEAPKGELGFYLVSDGTAQPWRYHVRSPSFINLSILEEICKGHLLADAVLILGSLDIVMGEVDH